MIQFLITVWPFKQVLSRNVCHPQTTWFTVVFSFFFICNLCTELNLCLIRDLSSVFSCIMFYNTIPNYQSVCSFSFWYSGDVGFAKKAYMKSPCIMSQNNLEKCQTYKFSNNYSRIIKIMDTFLLFLILIFQIICWVYNKMICSGSFLIPTILNFAYVRFIAVLNLHAFIWWNNFFLYITDIYLTCYFCLRNYGFYL